MNRIIEIRAAEGGADAQILVGEIAAAYTRLFDRFG
jgi:protein subunit release factor A